MKLAALLNEAVKFTVYNYGADQSLFKDSANSPEEAVDKARAGLAKYGYDNSKLENVVMKDDGEYGTFIRFPDAHVSIEFNG